MIYQLTADSSHYINWTSSMPPIYCGFLKLCGYNFNLVVILQILLLIISALIFIKFLNLKTNTIKALSFCALISPVIFWGLKIGNDLMGYSLMLLALSIFHKNKWQFLALLATLTRWQYCFLFCLFLLDRKTIKYFILSSVFIFLIAFKCGLNPVSRLSIPLNYIEFQYDKKPDKISHAVWFNKNLDNLGGEVKAKYFNAKKFAIVLKDKIRDNFRLHQLLILPLLLLLLGSPRVKFLVIASLFHYAEIFLVTSPYFQRYTFMVELCIIVAMLKFYEDFTRLKNNV